MATGAFFVSAVSANTTWAVATGTVTTSTSSGSVITWTVITTTWTTLTWTVMTGSVATTWTVENLSWTSSMTWDLLIATLLSSASTWTNETTEVTLPTMSGETLTWATKPANIDEETWNAWTKLFETKVTKLAPANTEFFASLSRWEAALLLKRFAVEQLNVTSKKDAKECMFKDTSSLDETTAKEVEEACTFGLFKGTDSNFMPNAKFTRWQAIIVIARILSGEPTMELDDAYDYLLDVKIIKVDDRKESARELARAELYIMISRILTQKEEGTLPAIWAWDTQQLIDLMEGLLQK